eukprot:tig00000133_g7712.t1
MQGACSFVAPLGAGLAARRAPVDLGSATSIAGAAPAVRARRSRASSGPARRYQFVCEAAPASETASKPAAAASRPSGPDSFPAWMPKDVSGLTEPASITQAKRYQLQPIQTDLIREPIDTAFVRLEPEVPNLMSFIYPVVCLHGFDSNSFEYRRLLPLLSQRVETYAVDMLGFGFTDRTNIAGWDAYPKFNDTIGPDAIRRHLYAFWKQVVKRPMTLVGASLGGAAALDFALEYPEAVHQLVLIDSAGYDLLPPAAKLLVPPIDRLAMEYLRSQKLREQAGTMSYVDTGLSTPDAVLCGRLHTRLPKWVEANIDFMKSGGFRVRDRIPEVQQETLVLWGEADQIVPPSNAQRFSEDIPRSRLTVP